MRISKPFLLIFFSIYWLVGLTAQLDSTSKSNDLFALTAADIIQDKKLVESFLNRTTTTAAQIEQFASEAPATVYVISKEQIQNRGYENLLDILEDLSEVEIQRYGSPEFNQHISFRGVAGNEKFLIFQDGIRISAPTGDTHSVGYNFSVEHAEQVEVIIGPASALYGADAFSGIIQIISQKGQDMPLQIKASYGNNGTTHNAINYVKDFGEVWLSINGTYYHSDEPDFTKAYPNEFAWYTNNYLPNGELLISPFFQVPTQVDIEGDNRAFSIPTSAYSVNVNAGLKDIEFTYSRHGDAYSSCGSTRPEYCVYSDESQFSYFIETIAGRYKYRSRNLKWLLLSTVGAHTYQLNNSTAFINTFTGYDAGYKMEFGKSKKIEQRVYYNHSRKLNLVGGLSYELLDDLPLTGDLPQPFDFNLPPDLQNQYYLGSNVIDKDGNDLSIDQDFYYLHYLNFGAYAQLQSELGSDLKLTAGIRYDNNTRYGNSVNPRLGLVWTPKEDLTLKMLYGESLLSPSPRKSHSHFGAFFPVTDINGDITGLGSNFFHIPNNDLKPEKLRSIESSLRYVLSNNLVFTLNGYYTKIDNIINKFTPNTAINTFQDIPIGFLEHSANAGTSTVYGSTVKIEAVYNLQNGLGLNFYAGYSFTEGDINGQQLLFNAKHHIKVGMVLNHAKFSISPRIIYRSTSYGSAVDETGNPIGSPAYTIVNLFAQATIFQQQATKISLFARVNNLLDNRYFNVFIGGAEGFPTVPQRPIGWTLGVKLNY